MKKSKEQALEMLEALKPLGTPLLSKYVTQADPQMFDVIPDKNNKERLLGYWYWVIVGRLYMIGFSLEPGTSPETCVLIAEKARRNLIEYVDAHLPSRTPRATNEIPLTNPAQVLDGGLLPKVE